MPEGLIKQEVKQHLENEGKAEDDEHGVEVAEEARKAFKAQLLLDAIAEKEQVAVGQQELIEYLLASAQQYRMEPNEFIKAVDEAGQVPQMVAEVGRRKALAQVLERAVVKDESGNTIDLASLFPATEEAGTTWSASSTAPLTTTRVTTTMVTTTKVTTTRVTDTATPPPPATPPPCPASEFGRDPNEIRTSSPRSPVVPTMQAHGSRRCARLAILGGGRLRAGRDTSSPMRPERTTVGRGGSRGVVRVSVDAPGGPPGAPRMSGTGANTLGSEIVSQLIVPGDYQSAGDSFNPPAARSASSGMGYDDHIYNRLLKDRIIWLGSEVRDENANAICAQMLLLAAEDPDKDIFLYINSPGGSVTAGMAIYDTMQFVSCDVATVAMGLAASMGQFLLSAGAKGKRYALPHARIMMHQPLGGIGGSATDIRIQAELILHIKKPDGRADRRADRADGRDHRGRLRPRPLVHRHRGGGVRHRRPRRPGRPRCQRRRRYRRLIGPTVTHS